MLRDNTILIRLVLVLLLGFLAVVTTFTVNFDWPTNIAYIDRFLFLNRYFVDFLQVAALIVLLNSGNTLLRCLAVSVSFMFVLAYFVQSQSFASIGAYLPAIALENSDHLGFLALDNIVLAGLVWLILFYLVWRFILSFLSRTSFKSSMVFASALVVLSIAIKNDDRWLDEDTLAARFDFYNSGRAGVLHKSPLGELLATYQQYQRYLDKQNFIAAQATVLKMNPKTAEFVYDNYSFFSKYQSEYPLMHETRYSGEGALQEFGLSLEKKKNIIIFFAEGISSRAIQPYSDLFDGLTPNIQEFAERAIRVDNYSNHTFATYRGLGGQLCSFFPVGRLYNSTDYYCLGHALKDQGYETSFMVSQSLDQTDLDLVTEQAGFDHIYGAEEILKSLPDERSSNPHIVPDRILIEGLIKKLESRGESGDQPFVIGLYNFETHTGTRLFEQEDSYVGTKENPRAPTDTLDTFHNFDRVFGKFWNYFRESEFYGNTIVILTSDHATFHSKDYRRLMQTEQDYAPIFIDKIPLLIYHPDLVEPKSFDAKSATSLDFAPSVLHLSGVTETKTPFLGKSLFLDIESRPYALVGGGAQQMWWQDKHQRWNLLNDESEKKLDSSSKVQESRRNFLKYVQSLEQSNKLWLKE